MVEIAAIYYDDIYFREWMLVAYDDWFIPEVVQLILEVVAELTDEEAALTLTCHAFNCEGELMRN